MTNKKILNAIIFWLPVVLWACVIFTFSSHPTGQASQFYWNDFIVKKTAHVTEYAIFVTLIYRALRNTNDINKSNALKVAILFAVSYALTDEFHQGFTPGREPTLRDVGFDTIGASLAAFTIWNIIPRLPKRQQNWLKKLDIV